MDGYFLSVNINSFVSEPLTHDFMRKAILISSLVAAVCGLLSSFLTLKGWALMGDAVSHAVMPGVVVAYALGVPFSLGAFILELDPLHSLDLLNKNLELRRIQSLDWFLQVFLL